jgi:hypothetical protein
MRCRKLCNSAHCITVACVELKKLEEDIMCAGVLVSPMAGNPHIKEIEK